MSCGSRPSMVDSQYQSFNESEYNNALGQYQEALEIYNQAGGDTLLSELRQERAKAEADQAVALQELQTFKEENVSKIKDDYARDEDGNFVFTIDASIELLDKTVELLDEAVIEVLQRAPETITQDTVDGPLSYTRGSNFALNSYALSNLVFTRNEIFVDGIGAVMDEMVNATMAQEQAILDTRAASAYARLSETMDRQERISNVFRFLGFALGATVGAVVGGGAGAAAGATLGAQTGSFLGSLF